MRTSSILRPLILSSLVACASHSPVFQTGFGPELANDAHSKRSAEHSALDSLAIDEEGDENPSAKCRQEFGSDAGATVSAAHPISAERVNGCFVRGDSIDSFVLTVPANDAETVFLIDLENRGGSALSTTIKSVEGTTLALDSWILEGDTFTSAITLSGGERVVIQVTNRQESASPEAWYRLEAAMATALVGASTHHAKMPPR